MLQTHNTRTEGAQHDTRRYPTGQRRLSVVRPVVAAGRPRVEVARATGVIRLAEALLFRNVEHMQPLVLEGLPDMASTQEQATLFGAHMLSKVKPTAAATSAAASTARSASLNAPAESLVYSTAPP